MSGLHLDGVTVRFGATLAVAEATLQVPSAGVLAVLGPSGCGKSTLLRAVAGLEVLEAGRISYDGQDLRGIPTHQRGFAMMFQDGQLFMHTDVAGNVGYALGLQGMSRADREPEVQRLLDLVGLSGYAARHPATLSGGEAQRVALARALAARPRLLLLDEPLSALDRSLRERLAADLRQVLIETGTTALLVTHDHDEAFAVADRTALMRAGRVVQVGPTAAVWRHPVDAEAAHFLGYDLVLDGARARRLLAAAGDDAGDDPALDRTADQTGGSPIALRASAIQVDRRGRLAAVVRSVAPGREGARLVLDVDGVGELPAVAQDEPWPQPGARVTVRVDPERITSIGRSAAHD